MPLRSALDPNKSVTPRFDIFSFKYVWYFILNLGMVIDASISGACFKSAISMSSKFDEIVDVNPPFGRTIIMLIVSSAYGSSMIVRLSFSMILTLASIVMKLTLTLPDTGELKVPTKVSSGLNAVFHCAGKEKFY